MKYIDKIILTYNSFLKMKNEFKKIEVKYMYISSIDIDKNKEPDEMIKEYNDIVNFGFLSSHVIQNALSDKFSYVFDKVIEKITDNIDSYSLEYITDIIPKNSKFGIDFLVSLSKKYKNDTLEKRLNIDGKVKTIFKDYYKQLFYDSNQYLLYDYITTIKVDDNQIIQHFIDTGFLNYAINLFKLFKKDRSVELENKLLNYLVKNNKIHPDYLNYCVSYAINVFKNPWMEFEKIIIENEFDNYYYYNWVAEYISHYKRKLDPFNEKILNREDIYEPYNLNYVIDYFSLIRKSLSEKIISKLEKIILNDKNDDVFERNVYSYSKKILKRRWTEQEDKFFDYDHYNMTIQKGNKIISKDKNKLEYLIIYIKNFKITDIELDKKFMDIIKKDYMLSYKFALAVKKAVPELEPSIARGGNTSFNYATKILRARFPLGEKIILKSRKANQYRVIFNL
jgi:hypothetical protein